MVVESYKTEITPAHSQPSSFFIPHFRQASAFIRPRQSQEIKITIANMVSFRNLLASALAISSGIALGATLPATERSLVKRGRTDVVLQILKTIGAVINDNVYTWEFKKFPQYCKVHMETRDGGHCYATVECKEGGKMEYTKFDYCKVGGTNEFEDPRIGKFIIGFRTRDGYEGEGLTEPTFVHWDVSKDWPFSGKGPKVYDVTALAQQYKNTNRCEAGIAPLNCDNGPFICHFIQHDNKWIQQLRKKEWECGIPIKGDTSLDTLEMPTL
ncbi:hypothetical protein IQ06DRAFT_363700 [Phaeosphaeriaceae sp. SRC1lsM3a]|nr:hypothetical protein IQ06DRAFT_363700 [Stagonospora sp. SRC1lsM3a]